MLMRGKSFRPVGANSVAVIDTDRHESSCFADEVVIDFPSMAPAVDRMRRGFLGEERSISICTAIQLTRREAWEGATVPLEVPVRCTCRGCGGRGETWAETCHRCHGSGMELKTHHVRVCVPAGVLDGTRFRFIVAPRHTPPTRIELRVVVD